MLSDYKAFLSGLDRKAYHEDESTWEEDGFTVTRSYHWSPPGCHNSCGILIYAKDGKLDHIEGDPLSPWVNGRLCMRCLNLDESCNSSERVKYPLRRVGERGENKWERISWDEALDLCAEKVRYYRETYGNETVSVAHGTGRNINWQVPYLAFVAFKTPTVGTQFFPGISCYLPRLMAGQAAAGDYFIVDASMAHEDRYANQEWTPPEVAIIWGNEPLRSNADGYIGHWLVQCVQMGTKIISVDPRVTWWGAHSEYHLQIRPGTDAALAMAMLHVLIFENLYDEEFVSLWTSGFDELSETVRETTPEWAAAICDIDAKDIVAAARLYGAARPGTIQWGLPFEQQSSAMGLDTAVMGLLGLCGNIDVPGGVVLIRNAFNIPTSLSEDYLGDNELRNRRLSRPREGYPWGDLRSIMRALEGQAVNSQKMFWIQSTNPLACTAMDAPRIYDIRKLHEFVVVCDPYITPTAVACADIILPVAMSPERNSIRSWWTPLRLQTKATQYYEAKSDEEIILEMGKRLNPEGFPWDDDLGFLEWYLRNEGPIWLQNADKVNEELHTGNKTSGQDFALFDSMYNFSGQKWRGTIEDLKAHGSYAYDSWNATYRKFEKGLLRKDGQVGFATSSGRFEFIPALYNAWGMNPHPYFVEPYQSPVATPEIFAKYPLILVTGARSFEFFHSENRQLPTMREFHPWPILELNPTTAERYGIQEGSWVWVENDQGRFKQVAKITPTIKDGVIHAEHGWWFPEQEGAEPRLFGTFDANPNNVIPADVQGPYGIAAPIKNMLVTIYPLKEGDIDPSEQVTADGGFEMQKKRRENYQKQWETQEPYMA
jgi:anaerobic selenocysteine-containing dehydrogenase